MVSSCVCITLRLYEWVHSYIWQLKKKSQVQTDVEDVKNALNFLYDILLIHLGFFSPLKLFYGYGCFSCMYVCLYTIYILGGHGSQSGHWIPWRRGYRQLWTTVWVQRIESLVLRIEPWVLESTQCSLPLSHLSLSLLIIHKSIDQSISDVLSFQIGFELLRPRVLSTEAFKMWET